MSFYVETAGRWSGGGSAFLNNARQAAARHAILRGEPGQATPIIARNVPTRGARPQGTYVIAPQNAWPWTPIASGVRERTRVAALRAASEIGLRRASAVMRISSAIPDPHCIPASPVIHNVLDEGFEDALAHSTSVPSPWPGQLVSIGSGYSYRNLPGLLDGYRAYRADGGTTSLIIAGPTGSDAAVADAEAAARDLPGVTFVWESIPRTTCLAAMREASAVVLPSRVEASPLTALEACAVTPRVVLGDITGNRGILAEYGQSREAEQAFANTTSPKSFARALAVAEAGGASGTWHDALAAADVRAEARDRWGERLATWLQELQDVWAQDVKR